MIEKILQLIDQMMTEEKIHFGPRSNINNFEVCWLCYGEESCYHKHRINALEELKDKIKRIK